MCVYIYIHGYMDIWIYGYMDINIYIYIYIDAMFSMIIRCDSSMDLFD